MPMESGKAICDFILVSNSNVYLICSHLREIRNQIVQYFDLDLYNVLTLWTPGDG